MLTSREAKGESEKIEKDESIFIDIPYGAPMTAPVRKTRIIISGDRNWGNVSRVASLFKDVMKIYPPSSTVLFHGGCRGADTVVGEEAKKCGYEVRVYPVSGDDWKRLGRAAGPLRNIKMIEDGIKEGGVDLILIFHDNLHLSRGTKSFVEAAKKKGLWNVMRMCP